MDSRISKTSRPRDRSRVWESWQNCSKNRVVFRRTAVEIACFAPSNVNLCVLAIEKLRWYWILLPKVYWILLLRGYWILLLRGYCIFLLRGNWISQEYTEKVFIKVYTITDFWPACFSRHPAIQQWNLLHFFAPHPSFELETRKCMFRIKSYIATFTPWVMRSWTRCIRFNNDVSTSNLPSSVPCFPPSVLVYGPASASSNSHLNTECK